ncbi:GNAT family N-acetyltransferase [Clostridiaceae bacterium M8S5]|nr:GNAT family N-acetyltransferase [Clostridiaceae bacterium M8S5]
MINSIQIYNMQDGDIDEAKKIWVNQYELYCSKSDFPSYWKEDTSLLEKYLRVKIKSKRAVVAKLKEKVVGFLTYDEFPFNGESSVFCPAIGHAAIEELKESVYLALYKYISQKWIDKNIFNHMWTIFFDDIKLKTLLFDLGYGSYLIDAFSECNKIYNEKSICDIRKAELKDVDELFELVKESSQYYTSAPLFLRRDEVSHQDLEEIIVKNNVYIAWYQDEPVGFINLSITKNNNFIDMSIKNCGLIDEIGAYIKQEYRNKSIGVDMLKCVIDYCRKSNAPYIHVDFETANLYGNKFWKKYFSPMLLSMRRTINKNINDNEAISE